MKSSVFILSLVLLTGILSCNGQSGDQKKTEVSAQKSVQQDKPVYLSKADFLNLVADYEKNPDKWEFKGEKPCLIDFYADWCAPCRLTGPILEDLAKQYAGKINIYKINIDKEQELSEVFGIQSIPTFIFCPMEGMPTKSMGIANGVEETRKMFIQQIEQLLLKTPSTSSSI